MKKLFLKIGIVILFVSLLLMASLVVTALDHPWDADDAERQDSVENPNNVKNKQKEHELQEPFDETPPRPTSVKMKAKEHELKEPFDETPPRPVKGDSIPM